MRTGVLFAASLAAALLQAVSQARAAEFSAYPAPIYRGPVKPPAFAGPQREYAMYRTRIRGSVAQGPAFGGHYALAVIGCGAGCRFGYVTDLRSGIVHDLPLGGEDYPVIEYTARADSRLLKARWELRSQDDGAPECAFEEFIWTGQGFTPLGKRRTGPCES